MSETKFYFKDSFMTAMKKVIEGKPVCTGCSMRFFSHKDLERHLKYCDAQKNTGSEILPADRPSCNICGLVFISEYDLANHKNTHKESPWECELCEKRFQRKLSYQKHVKNQHTKIFCDDCQMYFPTAKALADHRSKVHKDSVEKYMSYVCQYCHEHFNSPQNLKEHTKQKHDDEKDKKESFNLGVFMCVLCSRRFNSYADLRKHIASHPATEKKDDNEAAGKRRRTENGEEDENWEDASEQPLVLQVKPESEDDEGLEGPVSPPQLSPRPPSAAGSARDGPGGSATAPAGSTDPSPPALERAPGAGPSTPSKETKHLLPTQRFAKGHGSTKWSPTKQMSSPASTNETSSSATMSSQTATTWNSTQVSPSVGSSQASSRVGNSAQTRSSPRFVSAARQSTTLVQTAANQIPSSTQSSASSESSAQEPERERPPSKVWQRHLEKMQALASKQKQYEQDQQLKKLQNDMSTEIICKTLERAGQYVEKSAGVDPLKRVNSKQKPEVNVQQGETVNNKGKISDSQGCDENVKSSDKSKSEVEYSRVPTEAVRSSTSTLHTNGSNLQQSSSSEMKKAAVRFPRKVPQQAVASKMTQRLQRQHERREKFIKQHEDLLNQELVEGEIPAAELENQSSADKASADLEIELKLDDGSTAVIDLDKTADS